MSEYLDQIPRTEEEVLTDIRKTQAKRLIALTNRVINLCEEMQKTAEEINQMDGTKHWCGD